MHFKRGRDWMETQRGRINPKPVSKAIGRCATATSQ
jgi:hypothetical protein